MFDTKPNPPGSGGIAPGNEPQRPNEGDWKRVWYIEQIYDPDVHPVKDMPKYIVPYEGELIIDTPNHKMWQVSHVDKNATWKSTLVPYFFMHEDPAPEYDLFPKHEYGFLQGELALMIDYTNRPPYARVDANATAPNAAYALLYKGSLIGEKGEVISASYSGMDLINDQIGVSPVVFDNLENKTIMGCNAFSVKKNEAELPNGTRCTLVFYDQGGTPIPPTYPVTVQHSAYLRDHQLSKKYVKSTELLSPWFTISTKPNTMYIPINLALKSVEFRARIHYSDGSSVEQPVNSFNGDNGFVLHGLDQYKPTTPGQRSDALVLTYVFKDNEQAMIAQPGAPKHMSNQYEIVAVPAEGAYSPRMYAYPYWDNAVGWKLRHFLTDLDRKYCRDITDKVVLNEASPVFQGKKFGEEQPMIFNLNMRDVAANYAPWAFVQHTTITLYNNNTAEGRKWDTRHSYGKPPFNNMTIEYWESTGGGTPTARFNGVGGVADFLTKGYWAFEPMYDPRTEVKAPEPTHFDLVKLDGTASTAQPIGNYNALKIPGNVLNPGETLFIRWTRREASGAVLQLGVSAAVTKKISNPGG